jgi:hypothetical protein
MHRSLAGIDRAFAGLPTAISAILCTVTVRLRRWTEISWPVELTVLRSDYPLAKHIPFVRRSLQGMPLLAC